MEPAGAIFISMPNGFAVVNPASRIVPTAVVPVITVFMDTVIGTVTTTLADCPWLPAASKAFAERV